MKMCTDFTADIIWMNTKSVCSVRADHHGAVADALCDLRNHQRTLLVVKAENMYRNTSKIHKTIETELSH